MQLGRTIEALETPTAASTSPVKATLTDPATPPGTPSSPQTRVNLALGLGLGIAGALLRETLDTTVATPAELEELTEAPSLGVVVLMDDNQNRALSALDATNVKSEGYRTIRANLQFVSVDEPLRTIVVTSAEQADGKSTLACNLAIALAQSGKSVCLVEADLRRPRIAKYFDIHASIGLTDVLAGQRTLDDVIQPWGRGLLSLLPPGSIPPNPSELLGSHQLQTVLDDLKARFDVIILDSSPLLAVSDAAILAAQADGAILVVRHGKTSKDDVLRAVVGLEQVNARLLGTVLNAVPAKRRYGYTDGYGYGYGQTKSDRKFKKTKTDAPPRRLPVRNELAHLGDLMRTVGRQAAITASAIAIAGLGMGVLGACSSGSSSDSTSQVPGNPNANNQQDSVFANQTVSLNEQLITLTDVLSAKTDDDAIATELEGLGRTANERIELASGWLTSWGRSNSGAPDPPVMLTGRQVTAIRVANGQWRDAGDRSR